MQQTNVPFKVALGYIIVAIVLILAIGLVYRHNRARYQPGNPRLYRKATGSRQHHVQPAQGGTDQSAAAYPRHAGQVIPQLSA